MFLDTANIKEINRYVKLRFIKGVTTNLTLLLRENLNRKKQIENITKINSNITFIQVIGSSTNELWHDYKIIQNIYDNDNLAIKVPLNYEGLNFIQLLKNMNQNVLF